MTKAQQDENVLDRVAKLRLRLDEIDESIASGDSLRTLELADSLASYTDSILWSATASVRSEPGRTWAEIGGHLGVTRQAAHQRLGSPSPKRTGVR
jgi:hypothetical protein